MIGGGLTTGSPTDHENAVHLFLHLIGAAVKYVHSMYMQVYVHSKYMGRPKIADYSAQLTPKVPQSLNGVTVHIQYRHLQNTQLTGEAFCGIVYQRVQAYLFTNKQERYSPSSAVQAEAQLCNCVSRKYRGCSFTVGGQNIENIVYYNIQKCSYEIISLRSNRKQMS